MADTDIQEQTEFKKGNPEKRKNLIMVGILLIVMMVEGAGVFVLVKHFGSANPNAANAEGVSGLNPDEGEKKPAETEVEVVSFRAQNNKAQRAIIYDFVVYASISKDKAEDFKTLVESKKATIQDRFTQIVRGAEPEQFQEPNLATLRRKFKAALDTIAGDEQIVLEVLFPSLVPYSEY